MHCQVKRNRNRKYVILTSLGWWVVVISHTEPQFERSQLSIPAAAVQPQKKLVMWHGLEQGLSVHLCPLGPGPQMRS